MCKIETTIRVPISTFLKSLVTPVASYEDWWKEVTVELLNKALKTDFSNAAIESAIDETYAHCLESSNILVRIQQALDKLQNLDEHAFLGRFSQQPHPVQFWTQFQALTPQQTRQLKNIIGDGDGLSILKNASDERVTREALRLEIDTIIPIEEKKNRLLNTVFVFQNRFDFNNIALVPIPIAFLNLREFTETFRSSLSRDPHIRFNGERLVAPHFKQGINDEDYLDHFVEWLMNEIQYKTGTSNENLKGIFGCMPKIDEQKLQEAITSVFKKEFKNTSKPLVDKVRSCFAALQKKKNPFGNQMLEFVDFVADYLPTQDSFKDQQWEQVSKDLISIYRRVYELKEKNQLIPCLSLLKAMSYDGYATCSRFFIKDLCPALSGYVENEHCMKSNVAFITEYDIHFDPNTKFFKVTQIKSFHVMERPKKSQILPVPIDTVFTVHWTVSGQLGSNDYSAELNIPEMVPQCGYGVFEKILDQFHCEIKEPSWKSFTTRKKL